MDAVHSRVIELKGTLHIGSEAGQGCRVELQLPLSLISVHALLVPAGDISIAVSSRGVDQILYPGAGVLQREGDTLTFRLEEHVYEAWHLETLLQMPVPADAEQSHERPVLLVRDETSTVRAVCVSGVRATQDLVVKQMGPLVPQLAGIEGTTILGDGSVAPLIDVPILLGTDTHDSAAWIHDRPVRNDHSEERPCALVVDDSLSARRSLAEFMQDLGYEVLTARDGLEAIEVMAERLPQILLVDLEMPRMNGLELAAHVRAQQSTRSIPTIMITSRSTEKHRQKAQAAGVDAYLTKPFSEDELNDQIQAVLSEPERNLA
jgi:chemosensory pili system protein ChpA (sensor histidine kinase/response regulator)